MFNKIELTPQEKELKRGRLNEKKAQDLANMMRVILERRGVSDSELKSEDYDLALKTVEDIIELANKEPNMEKFKNKMFEKIEDVSALPGAVIASIFDTLIDVLPDFLESDDSIDEPLTKTEHALYGLRSWFKHLRMYLDYDHFDAQSELDELKEDGKWYPLMQEIRKDNEKNKVRSEKLQKAV